MSAERYALCRTSDNYVTNITIWDAVLNPNAHAAAGITPRLMGALNVGIGDTFDGTTLTKAVLPPDTPTEANRKTLLEKGRQALTANATFLAIPSPTNLQTLAQVQSLTRQMNAVIRLVGGFLDDTSGT